MSNPKSNPKPRSLTQAEKQQFHQLEAAVNKASSAAVWKLCEWLDSVKAASRQSLQGLADELGGCKAYYSAMLKAYKFAKDNWKGEPKTVADARLFLALAYNNLARHLKSPGNAAHAAKLGIKVKARSTPVAKPWTEKLAAAVRAALADGADVEAIQAAVDQAIAEASESSESESDESGEIAAREAA